MTKEVLDEREFELINILGADLGSNQRDFSRHMQLSLGMVNMTIRRLISKGYIRIEQLNKRKVQYILTPKGFAEKMRKSVKYTMKTISSIGLIKNRVKEIMTDFYKDGVRDFYYYGNPDISIIVEMVIREAFDGDCSFRVLSEIPKEDPKGALLICREGVNEEDISSKNYVDLVRELAKHNHYHIGSDDSAFAEN